MKLSTKIIIGIVVALAMILALEVLVSSYFMDQFGHHK